jgi:hypothetical protein
MEKEQTTQYQKKKDKKWDRVREIAYGFGGPSEKKCQSSLIFYCKIPILCQSFAKSSQILLVMSDRTEDVAADD